jgi:tRNA dimethylallyltransferase
VKELNNLQKLIVLIGPTAVGKTELSIHLAKQYNGEIISGDSMQIYKGMDIGTAKISKSEMEGIPHHLLDIKEADEAFSVAEFQQLVRDKISDIHSRNAIPMIVGGTGLYIQSVIYDYQFSDEVGSDEFRKSLEKRASIEGNMNLYDELKSIDPESAEKIHPNNSRRVIRALEIYHCTGKTVTEYQKIQQPHLLYDVALIGLTMERSKLYDRINQRVDIMIQKGLKDEVKKFYDLNVRHAQSIQAIGYKELYAYFDGQISFDEAVNQLKQNSRRYAKRQLTWFRNKMDVIWYDMSEETERRKKIEEISNFIAGKLQLKSNK